jgi:glutamyl-tRNA synthetase
MSRVRTRYAPSPTGKMHVGNLRTALYEYLIAKHEEGDFLLRIEDTDQERFVEGAVDIIYNTLKITGLTHDEGPDKDGGCGPYVQSERQATGMYMEYAKQLIEKGEAYYCFCTKERLSTLKSVVSEEEDKVKNEGHILHHPDLSAHQGGQTGVKEIIKYDKHCLHLSKEEIKANLAAGIPYVIRQNIPVEGSTTFHDAIYGDITVENAELDDMILIKSDGFPTYNFANVVDDHLMRITHVVRGNEYLSSSPKYTRLYHAFGWEEPIYVHCPLITNEEHKKLSKRSGHSSFEDLLDQGFVTEAIVNFIALLGWSSGTNEEIFSLEELVKEFDYHHINKSPAVFDMAKLRWMNGEYIKKMDNERYYELAIPYVQEVIHKDLDLAKVADLVKSRIETFLDIKDMIDFFEEIPDYDTSMYTHKKMKTDEEISLSILKEQLPLLEALEDYSVAGIEAVVMGYIGEKGIKNGMGLWPVRTAVSGKQSTPGGAYEIMNIIGKDESIRRIKLAIDKLSSQ